MEKLMDHNFILLNKKSKISTQINEQNPTKI